MHGFDSAILISVLESDVQPSTSQKYAECVKPYCHEFRVKVIGIMYRGMALVGGKVYLYAVIHKTEFKTYLCDYLQAPPCLVSVPHLYSRV